MKRLFCMLLALALLLCALPTPVTAAGDSRISPAFLRYLQEKYPNGKYWNHEPGQPNNPDGYTDKPCAHHGAACRYDGSCGCNSFDEGIQCLGFAAKLAYEYSGTYSHAWQRVATMDNLKAGDVVRINHDQHSIFITEIRGEDVYYADCNIASDCMIRWNAKTTKKALQEALTYVKVAPVNTAAPVTPTLTYHENYKFGETVKLSWRPLPNADEYRISISLNGTLLRTVTVTEASVFDYKPEDFGAFTFAVTAANAYGASSPAFANILVDPHDCEIKQFTDVKNFLDWSHAGIEYAVVNGLFKGTSETTFSPDATMTRGMIATVLWRMEDCPETQIENLYADVAEGTWYTDAVLWAKESGVMDGVGGGLFDPDGVLTREQIVTVLFRYSGAAEHPATDPAVLSVFADEDSVADWSKDAVCWAVLNQVIQGSSQNGVQYLTPTGGATRAQVATILMRFLEDIAVR